MRCDYRMVEMLRIIKSSTYGPRGKEATMRRLIKCEGSRGMKEPGDTPNVNRKVGPSNKKGIFILISLYPLLTRDSFVQPLGSSCLPIVWARMPDYD